MSGFELDWKWEPGFQSLWMGANWSTCAATNRTPPDEGKQLPFIPRHQIHAEAGLILDGWLFILDGHYSSRSYTTTENVAALSVAPYFNFGSAVGYSFSMISLNASIRLHVDNVFDTPYEIMKGYPMPLRNFRLSVRFANERIEVHEP
jgi:outer membrane receptor protein involved in Fe transport